MSGIIKNIKYKVAMYMGRFVALQDRLLDGFEVLGNLLNKR
jgi:hypothetical protein